MGHKPLLAYGAEENRQQRLDRVHMEWYFRKSSRIYADYICSVNEEEPELDGEMLQYVYSTCVGITKAIAQVTTEAADRYYIGF